MSLAGFEKVVASLPEKERQLALRRALAMNAVAQRKGTTAIVCAAIWVVVILAVVILTK